LTNAKMDKTHNIKLISLDLFGTLVNVQQSRDTIWRNFLGKDYTEELGHRYWDMADVILRHKVNENPTTFKSVRTIFNETYTELFSKINVMYDPILAADALMKGHNLQNIYPDTKQFLRSISTKYQICVSSDCDMEMLAGIHDLHKFDAVFSSEQLGYYKSSKEFWIHVLDHYNIAPQDVLHIGDANSDIIIPKQLGMITCWLNRHSRIWDSPIRPDFEVNSLKQILEIMNLK
jgi:HAD superfamily hydrolase (TIGR01549 family)